MSGQHSIEAVMGRLTDVIDDLDAVPRCAHAAYLSYPPEVQLEHSARTQANCIYDHMVAEADRRFQGRSDIRTLELRGLKLWLLGDDIVFRWKKMDDEGRCHKLLTDQEKDFDRMEPLDGLPEGPTRIYVGYCLDPTGQEIKRVQIARPNFNRVDWCAAIVPVDERDIVGYSWEDVTKQTRLVS